MKITRRPAQGDDKSFACDAHHKAYRDVVLRTYGAFEIPAQDKFFEETWAETPHEILLYDGKPGGYAAIVRTSDFINIVELVVHPYFQGRGIGSFILKETIKESEAKNIPVRLRTQLANKAAELYKRHGFTEYDRTETHILMGYKGK